MQQDTLMNTISFGSSLKNLPQNIVYMKYGTHVSEKPDDIILRKINECNHSGKTFWGYGGTLCHPIKQVQPFVRENQKKGEKTYLVLSRSNTVYEGYPYKATIYSKNKIDWEPIPNTNIVLGSSQAIICKKMETCNFVLDLADYEVPVGNCTGRKLSQLLSWHINKSCGRRVDNGFGFAPIRPVYISVIAEIEDAVFVR